MQARTMLQNIFVPRGVRAKEEDSEAARPVVVLELVVSFQNFNESERSNGKPIAVLRDFTWTKVRNPIYRSEVSLSVESLGYTGKFFMG